jgi:hypothetical protein
MSNTMKDALFLLALGVVGAWLCSRVNATQTQPQIGPLNLSRNRFWYRSLN